MEKVIIRYKVKPEYVAENEILVKAVYKELHELSPSKFSYATYKLADGLTFIHIVSNLTGGKSPLSGLTAFKNFQAGIKERCEEQPVPDQMTEIGSYGFNIRADMNSADTEYHSDTNGN